MHKIVIFNVLKDKYMNSGIVIKMIFNYTNEDFYLQGAKKCCIVAYFVLKCSIKHPSFHVLRCHRKLLHPP